MSFSEAYLDIETTGLSRDFCDITVVGIYLVGDEISAESILEALQGIETVYT